MAEDKPSRSEEARANAAARFITPKEAKPTETGVWRERTKRHEEETANMLRLRALRLEKEAADKVAAALAPKAPGKRSQARGTKRDEDA